MNARKTLAAAIGATLALVGLGKSDSNLVKHYGQRPGRKDGVDPEQLKSALAIALQQRDADLRRLIEKAEADIKSTGEIATETKTSLQKLSADGVKLQEQLAGIEQEIAALKSFGQDRSQAQKSIGMQFTDGDEFKALQSRGVSAFKGTISMSLKAVTNVTSSTGGTTGDAGAAVAPDRLPGIQGPALRQFTIRDLLLPGRTSSNLVQYVQETGYQNNAGPAAETTLKPQSDIKFTLKDSPVRTLAHWLRASKQILADAPMLQSYIDTRLTYGLKYVEEAQLLSGDGTGENLLGLIPQATPYNDALRVAGDTKIDTIRRAILQVRQAEYRASAVVLNPADWADIELTKDANDRYIWVNVGTGASPQLWRLPVVDSSALPAGHFMVGAFNMAAQVFDREDANVSVSTEDGDNFVKNLVTIRAEERLAMVVFRPESFVYGPFVQAT
jgi:HK97 family phage major capsid protein